MYIAAPAKATSMLKKDLAPFLLEDLTSAMKYQILSNCIHVSNDTEMEKMNPITMRIYSMRSGKTFKYFLNMYEVTSAAIKLIYTALN